MPAGGTPGQRPEVTPLPTLLARIPALRGGLLGRSLGNLHVE